MNLKLSTFDAAIASAVADRRGMDVTSLITSLLHEEAAIELVNLRALNPGDRMVPRPAGEVDNASRI